MKDLGLANDWISAPDIVKECAKMEHERAVKTSGHIRKTSCEKCSYIYQFDLDRCLEERIENKLNRRNYNVYINM